MNEPDKLDLRSHDITEDKKQELLQLFPEIRTEGGKIDFERLKLALGEMVDVGKERYGMNWPGKADCFKTIQAPSLGTLLPCREENVNFDSTENLIIEGDNLEVLKLLQKSYLGKVKMIYIDPPYNTGNDFIYPDDYTESLQTYLEYTGQVDGEGRKFSTNTEADGRFHSKWLNMMYPRLYLARNLLREDGVIFISIDDHEAHNLRMLMNEVLGEENFVAQIVWKKRSGPPNDKIIGAVHEYLIVYTRSAESEFARLLPRPDELDEQYTNLDNDPRGPWRAGDLSAGNKGGRATPSCVYELVNPQTGEKHWPPEGRRWVYNEKKMEGLLADNRIWFGPDNKGKPKYKRFLSEVRKGVTSSTLLDNVGTNTSASAEFNELMTSKDVFETPKPVGLIKKLLQIGTGADSLVLDFFAGSCTTAHAVLELNHEDGGNRKFILVQLPEPTGREDYPTIADIAKERVRRVIQKLNEEDEGKLPLNGEQKQDRSFKVFKLAESNFKTWNANVPTGDVAALQQQLELHIDHIREGRMAEDILYEILLKRRLSHRYRAEKGF